MTTIINGTPAVARYIKNALIPSTDGSDSDIDWLPKRDTTNRLTTLMANAHLRDYAERVG